MGSFGTLTSPPAGSGIIAAPGYSQIGYFFDADGIGTGSLPGNSDFVLPGAPEEAFVIGFRAEDSAA